MISKAMKTGLFWCHMVQGKQLSERVDLRKKILFKEKHFWIIRNTTVQYLQQNFQKYFLKIRILIVQNVIPKQKTGPQGRWKNLEVVRLPLKNYSSTIIYITSTMVPSSAWYSVEPKSCPAKPVLSLWRWGGGGFKVLHTCRYL